MLISSFSTVGGLLRMLPASTLPLIPSVAPHGLLHPPVWYASLTFLLESPPPFTRHHSSFPSPRKQTASNIPSPNYPTTSSSAKSLAPSNSILQSTLRSLQYPPNLKTPISWFFDPSSSEKQPPVLVTKLVSPTQFDMNLCRGFPRTVYIIGLIKTRL